MSPGWFTGGYPAGTVHVRAKSRCGFTEIASSATVIATAFFTHVVLWLLYVGSHIVLHSSFLYLPLDISRY